MPLDHAVEKQPHMQVPFLNKHLSEPELEMIGRCSFPSVRQMLGGSPQIKPPKPGSTHETGMLQPTPLGGLSGNS